MNRRTILQTGGLAAAGILLKTSRAQASTSLRCTMVTTWSPKMPILQDAAERFAAAVETASEKRIRIKVYAGGELIPALGVFDAVSSGDVELGIGASYYWSGKLPASPFFTAIPFGFDAVQLSSWLHAGGGQALWEELYAPQHLIPISIGNTGPQMAGWFKKKIETPEDLKGLKIRMPGLGGKVLARAGANVVLMPGGELFTALERGTIDATEWISPFHDERLGLQRAASYCYYPGWQEPSANLELIMHSAAWQKCGPELQEIIRSCAAEVGRWCLEQSFLENAKALERLKRDARVELLPLPDSVLDVLRSHAGNVLDELATSDPLARKALDSYRSFASSTAAWQSIGLRNSTFSLPLASANGSDTSATTE